MGYTTEFAGEFKIAPPLTAEHLAEYGVMTATERDEMPSGAPNAYLQWVVSEDGTSLAWDGNEKFYEYVPWLEWLTANWFKPRGYTLSGSVDWQGEDSEDRGTIYVKGTSVQAVEDQIIKPGPVRVVNAGPSWAPAETSKAAPGGCGCPCYSCEDCRERD